MGPVEDAAKRKEALAKRIEGRQAFQKKDYQRALTLFSEAIGLDPEETGVYLERGDVYRSLGMTAELEADYAKRNAITEAQRLAAPVQPARAPSRSQGGPVTTNRPAQPPQSQTQAPPSANQQAGAAPGPGPLLPPPAELTVPYPATSSRLLLFVKWAAWIPAYILLALHGVYAGVVGFIGTVLVLFTGHYPKGLWDVYRDYLQHQARVYAYFPLGLTDDWSGKAITFQVDYAPKQSRLLVLVRLVALPFVTLLIAGALTAALLLALLAWFGILFTGKYPKTFFNNVVGLFGWVMRVYAWLYNLRDEKSLFRTTRGIWFIIVGFGLVAVTVLASVGVAAASGTLSAAVRGQEAMLHFVDAGQKSDVPAGAALFVDPAAATPKVAALFADRRLFDGLSTPLANRWNLDSDTSVLTGSGGLHYDSGPSGSFTVTLQKIDGSWKLVDISMTRPNALRVPPHPNLLHQYGEGVLI